MVKKEFIWECGCGYIAYGKYPPEECPKCWKNNSFIEIPEDIAEQKKESFLKYLENDETENEESDLDDFLR